MGEKEIDQVVEERKITATISGGRWNYVTEMGKNLVQVQIGYEYVVKTNMVDGGGWQVYFIDNNGVVSVNYRDNNGYDVCPSFPGASLGTIGSNGSLVQAEGGKPNLVFEPNDTPVLK